MLKFVGFLSLFFFTTISFSQTLIMNEVSQGITGNMEYVEFVVIDTTVSYNCASGMPPSIDIRGWIFDDNSGYHGTGGIAAGAIRFSFDPMWASVPLGTIILIYNDAQPEPSIPSVDISMADGNCTIVAPISNVNLFESNVTTPGAIACSYPATGWTPGGNWSNTLLANPGDCARIVNLSGCEVFSVCYGTESANAMIYFAGNAGNMVYYFNGGDPEIQSNWTAGCSDNETVLDANTCGGNDQTPGAANNAANATYIAQFNNNCVPIPPVAVSALVDNHEQCGCDGQASATGSGSIGPYTYEWFDAGLTPIGQNSSTATGLCPGTYFVTVTSSIDCAITQSVTINPGGGTPTFSLVSSNPNACGASNGSITVSGLNPSTGYSLSYLDDGAPVGPVAITTTAGGSYVITGLNAGAYSSITISSGPCSSLPASATLSDPTPPIATAGTTTPTICSGGSIALTGNTVLGATYSWTGPNSYTSSTEDPTISSATTAATGAYTLTITLNNCVSLPSTVNVTVNATPLLIITDPAAVCSPSTINITTAATTTGSSNVGTLTYWTDLAATTPLTTPSAITTSGTYYIQANNAGCTDIEPVVATIDITPVITDLADQTVCDAYTLPAITGTGLSGSQGYFNSPNGLGPIAVGTIVTTSQTVYIYDVNGTCSDQETVLITVNNTPVIDPIMNAVACGSYLLPAITGTNLTGGEAFYNNSQVLGGTSIAGPITTTQTVWVYDAEGSCNDETSFLVTINPLPTVTGLTGGNSYCVGEVVNPIEVTVTGSASWTIDYTLDGISQTITQSSSPISLGNVPGIYSITNVTDANCTNVASGTQTISVSPIPAEPTAGQDSLYCSSWTLTSMTVSGSGGTYTWYSDDQLTLELGSGSALMPIDVNGTNYYYVTETIAGCEGPADTVVITIQDCEIIVPTAFTPNGDEVHDVWQIVDLDEVYPNNVVTVFNRWGAKLYESEEGNYSGNPWNGTYDGNPLPVGSYYFIIDFNDPDLEPQKGIVSIVLEK